MLCQQHVENIVFTVEIMHPTTQRLYQALQVLLGVDNVGSTLAAKTLKVSSAQTINNWEERGVSKAGMVQASSLCGIRVAWIEREELPMIDPLRDISKKPNAQPAKDDRHPIRLEEPTTTGWAMHTNKVKQALGVLEAALTNLDMQGRERIAPLFESFARSPGPIIKEDITMLLASTSNKSEADQEASLQKAG